MQSFFLSCTFLDLFILNLLKFLDDEPWYRSLFVPCAWYLLGEPFTYGNSCTSSLGLCVCVISLVYFSPSFSLSGTCIIVILDLLDRSFYVPIFSLLHLWKIFLILSSSFYVEVFTFDILVLICRSLFSFSEYPFCRTLLLFHDYNIFPQLWRYW